MSRSYRQEDIQEILNLAIAQQVYNGEFSRDQLLEIAAEMEISAESLQQAETLWRQQQNHALQRQSFDEYRKSRLKRRVGRYAIVNTGLLLLNSLTGLSVLWSAYIALIWGLKLSLNAWNVYHTQGEAYENAFRRWNRQHLVRTWVQALTHRLFQSFNA
ncbi:MAG: 2TM domain-containing protein [Thermosynechococcaceae cyanobacterium]